MLVEIHLESTWSPHGIHGVHKIITRISNIRWTPHELHLEFMELCGICGVHLESMGECKVHLFANPHGLYQSSCRSSFSLGLNSQPTTANPQLQTPPMPDSPMTHFLKSSSTDLFDFSQFDFSSFQSSDSGPHLGMDQHYILPNSAYAPPTSSSSI